MNKNEETKEQELICNAKDQKDDSGPYLLWKYRYNQETGREELGSLELSDGSKLSEESFNKAIQKVTGASDSKVAEKILSKIARGMASDSIETRTNEASMLLAALKPQNEAEALLLGQFITLQDSAMKCLRLANLPDQGFYHEERLIVLAHKLLNTANQTMQTVLKYRSGGKQTIQIIHIHNETKTIVDQSHAPQTIEGEAQEKFEN